ncbi:MAG: hypothetical protein Q8S22_06155 [Eubacteriales bacterium]|jgi:hypothetical protein|nr:hypothetical protein [Eubacteriales bacterium]
MKKKLLIIIICAAVLLSACSPRLIGEAKAKEAGLALINQVFDRTETDAKVKLEERPGLSYVNGALIHMGDEDPIYYYTVKVGALAYGNSFYYAEVNATTGVAYRAEKSTSLVQLNDDEQSLAHSIGTLDDFHPDAFLDEQEEGKAIVWEYVKTHLAQDVPVFGVFSDMIETDSVDFPKIWMEYLVVLDDGRMFSVTLCWPTMEVIHVVERNQDTESGYKVWRQP